MEELVFEPTKGAIGRASPILINRMNVRIRFHSVTDKASLNILFYDYFDEIGKYYNVDDDLIYCSYEVGKDRIVFKFYQNKDSEDSDRYTLYPASSSRNKYSVGDPLCFQIPVTDHTKKFVPDRQYPVYRSNIDGSYSIRLEDVSRPVLFNPSKVQDIERVEVKTMDKSNNKSKKIDSNKLKKIFEQRGLKVADVGKDLGYQSSSGFSGALNRGLLTNQVIKALQTTFGIEPSSYVIDTVKRDVSNDDTQSNNGLVDSKVIFDAIKDDLYLLMVKAVKSAWSEM